MSPRRESGPTNPPPVTTPQNTGSADFSFYEMTAAVHQQLGILQKAVEMLEKRMETQTEKLDTVSKEVYAGKVLMKTLAWVGPLITAIAAALLTVVLNHVWK